MKRTSIFFMIFAVFVAFSSCESLEGSTKIAEKFYASIKVQDYETVVSMVNEKAFTITPREKWISGLKKLYQVTGKLKSYTKTGFNTKTNNGTSRTVLKYTVKYEKITFYEKLTIVNNGDDYKIEFYEYNDKKK